MSLLSSRSSPLPSASVSQRVAYGLLLLVLCGAAVLLAEGADLASRTAGLRLWALAGAGVFAMAPPNALLPDPNTPTLQLLNWSPARLLRYQLGRMGPLVLLVAVPAVLIVVDPAAPLRHLGAKGAALGRTLLLLLGAAGDSFAYFATLGPRSQAWQEGQAGQWYGRAVEERGQGISLPRGLVPVLFGTTRCFVVALVAILASALGAQSGLPVVAWGPGLLLLGWAGGRLWRVQAAYDRHFYHTTAFYEEVMGGGPSAAAGTRDPLPYDAVYWVPSRWRPAVWASLRQLDRRLRLGRLVALGHAGLWLLCLRGVPPSLIAGYLVVLFVAQTATCGLLTTPAAAPRPFQHARQSAADWVVTRAFVNLRWGLAHAGSLALVVLFDDGFGAGWALTWTAVYVGLAAGAAAVATLAHEGWGRRAAA